MGEEEGCQADVEQGSMQLILAMGRHICVGEIGSKRRCKPCGKGIYRL